MQIINCKNRSQKIYSKIEAHEIVCSGFIKVGLVVDVDVDGATTPGVI